MTNIVKGVLSVVVVALILLWFFVFISPHVLGLNLFTVLSGSMRPAIEMGGVIAVKTVPPPTIKVGDVITYRAIGAPVMMTHRVVEVVDRTGFRTKGDANDSPDQLVVPPGNLVGKVVFYLPYFGYVTKFVRTPFGLLFCLGIPAVAIISGEICKIVQVARSPRR